MSVAGSYDCTLKTPMGDQTYVMTVTVDGDSWSGDCVGGLGSLNCYDGKVSGDTISWSMDLVVPMPMKLEGTATISGDLLGGDVKAGAFGSFPLTGKRVG
jgi:hypothetical protein